MERGFGAVEEVEEVAAAAVHAAVRFGRLGLCDDKSARDADRRERGHAMTRDGRGGSTHVPFFSRV